MFLYLTTFLDLQFTLWALTIFYSYRSIYTPGHTIILKDGKRQFSNAFRNINAIMNF